MREKIYKFAAVDFASNTIMESYFPATADEIDWLLGKDVDFGEAWGKHPAMTVTMTTDHFTVVSADPTFVRSFKEEIGIIGSCPFDNLSQKYGAEYHCLFPSFQP